MSKNQTEWRSLSHYERVANPEHSVRQSTARFNKPYVQRCKTQQVVEGRVMAGTGWKTVLPSDNFEGVSALDFALENVIAAGAVDMLRERKVQVNSQAELSDMMEEPMENLSVAFDMQNNEENNED